MSAERPPYRAAAWISLAVAAAGILLLHAYFTDEGPPSPPAEPTRLSAAAELAPFFAALAALDDKESNGPVRILQIGDSHTANDLLSQRMRERLQSRFGAAGRGWLPAGIPFKWYHPHLVEVREQNWQHVKPNDHTGVALGFDAIAAVSQPPDAAMAIGSTEPRGFDHFGVEFLTQPSGSAFTVQIDENEPVRVSTAGATTAIKRVDLPLDSPARRVLLRAGERPPVVLLGWTLERREPGIIYENHGTIGATIGLLEQMTPAAVSFELDNRRPALLIVEFGTNEGFDDSLDLDRYAARFRANVEALRHAAHGKPVLLLGAGDAERIGKGCSPTSCRPDGEDCSWHQPPKLTPVRDLQRHIAAQEGWAYWDWFDAMGGVCSIDRLAGADTPQAMPDHVHLSTSGYHAMADLLFGDLMRAYDKWKAQPRTS